METIQSTAHTLHFMTIINKMRSILLKIENREVLTKEDMEFYNAHRGDVRDFYRSNVRLWAHSPIVLTNINGHIS